MLIDVLTLGWWLCPQNLPFQALCWTPGDGSWNPGLAASCLPFLAVGLPRSLSHTRAHTLCVSLHTPLGFFLFGFPSLYCFKLVPGLTASLNFICLSSPPPPLPLHPQKWYCLLSLLLSQCLCTHCKGYNHQLWRAFWNSNLLLSALGEQPRH